MVVPIQADQLLPQFLLGLFDTLPSQYRHTGHVHEEIMPLMFYHNICPFNMYVCASFHEIPAKGLQDIKETKCYRRDRRTDGQREKVQVGKDQEKAQSEKDSHSKNRGGKKPN